MGLFVNPGMGSLLEDMNDDIYVGKSLIIAELNRCRGRLSEWHTTLGFTQNKIPRSCAPPPKKNNPRASRPRTKT